MPPAAARRADIVLRDGLDELYLPRPDWDEQKAATTELAALRDCITAILSEQ